MNDDELIATMRGSFTRVRSATPVERIVRRSRAVRARRRIPRVAGALAVTAGAAVAVTTLAPAGPQADHHPPAAQLTAWTVTRQTGGHVSVIIRELSNAAGLEQALRADGVPASVTFGSQQNPACNRPMSGAGRPAPWAVKRQANGHVTLTIRELSDAPGLQRALRADGVPASVTFGGRPGPSCPPMQGHGKPRGQ